MGTYEAEHRAYVSGMANGAFLGVIYGCLIGVGIVVPGCHLYGVGEEPKEKIPQETPVKPEYKLDRNLPKITP